MGWVQRERNLGSIIFVDLRDTTGICQIVFDNTVSDEVFSKAEKSEGRVRIGYPWKSQN